MSPYLFPLASLSLPPALSHPSRWSQTTELISLCYAPPLLGGFPWSYHAAVCPSPARSEPLCISIRAFLTFYLVNSVHIPSSTLNDKVSDGKKQVSFIFVAARPKIIAQYRLNNFSLVMIDTSKHKSTKLNF